MFEQRSEKWVESNQAAKAKQEAGERGGCFQGTRMSLYPHDHSGADGAAVSGPGSGQ